MKSGERFKKLKEALAKKPGVYNPAGLAAQIGRNKLGQKKMTQLSEKGKK